MPQGRNANQRKQQQQQQSGNCSPLPFHPLIIRTTPFFPFFATNTPLMRSSREYDRNRNLLSSNFATSPTRLWLWSFHTIIATHFNHIENIFSSFHSPSRTRSTWLMSLHCSPRDQSSSRLDFAAAVVQVWAQRDCFLQIQLQAHQTVQRDQSERGIALVLG